MGQKHISVAGANTLLGQHFLARTAADKAIVVDSFHSEMCEGGDSYSMEKTPWQVDTAIADHYAKVPVLRADSSPLAPILISFLPDKIGEKTEKIHLARGTRLITHCEYARYKAPLAVPGVLPIEPSAGFLATPNCTTAMCALPLHHLHKEHKIRAVTITTLQAISGTDLPGMAAHTIHDQVIGHLEGEAETLTNELNLIFKNAFALNSFATRVPVWRGHTITMAISFTDKTDAKAVRHKLARTSNIEFKHQTARDNFSSYWPMATITNIRDGNDAVLIVLKGDNLEAATTGIMHEIVHMLTP